jgi:hypothetical protein
MGFGREGGGKWGQTGRTDPLWDENGTESVREKSRVSEAVERRCMAPRYFGGMGWSYGGYDDDDNDNDSRQALKPRPKTPPHHMSTSIPSFVIIIILGSVTRCENWLDG